MSRATIMYHCPRCNGTVYPKNGVLNKQDYYCKHCAKAIKLI